MENYIKLPSWRQFWVLLDLDNGHPGGHGYMWIFKTRQEVRDHRKKQHKEKFHSRLSQPQKIKM